MPPSPSQTPQGRLGPDHMLSEHKRASIGPVVGIVVILLLLGFGALYFWGASMNREPEPLPLIPGDSAVAPDA